MSPALDIARPAGDSRTLLIASNLFNQGVNFIGGLIVARVLGPVGRGNVAVVAVYDEASTMGTNLGVPAAVGNRAAAAPPDRLDIVEGELLGAALRIAAFSAPVVVFLAWLVERYALAGVPQSIRLVVFVAISSTPLSNSVPVACRMLLVARGQTNRLAFIASAPFVVRVGAIAGLALVDSLTPFRAAVAVIGSSWLSGLLAMAIVRVRPRRGGSAIDLIRFGVRTVPSNLAGLVNSRLDQLLMVPLLTEAELGIYAVAVGVAFIPVNVGSALGLAIYRTAAQDSLRREATRDRLAEAARWITISGICSAFGTWWLLVPIYGERFSDAVVPAMLLIVGSTGTGIALTLVQVANAADRPGIGSASAILGLAVTAVGLAIALPRFGVVGAAWVSLIAYSTQAAAAFFLLRRTVFAPPVGPRSER